MWQNKKLNSKISCSLAINYLLWHRKFKKGLLATDFGQTYMEEFNYYKGRLQFVKDALYKSNVKFGVQVQLPTILLDSERFHMVKKLRDITLLLQKGMA